MPVIYMLIAVLFWGASFLSTKIVLEDISTTSFLFFRFLVANLFMVPLLFFARGPVNKQLILHGAILGFLQTGIMLLQTLGLETLSASLSGFINGFYIVFVLLIRFVIQKKIPHLMDMMTTFMCLGGLALMTHDFTIQQGIGILYTLGSALFIAIYIYALDIYAAGKDSIMITFIQTLVIVVLTGAGLFLPGNRLELPTNTLVSWGNILFCGVLCTTVGFLLQNIAQKKLGAFKISILIMLEPVCSAIMAYFILGERFIWLDYIGIVLIISAVAIINIRLKNISS